MRHRLIASLALVTMAACSKPNSSTVAIADSTARALPPMADTAARALPTPPETVFVDRPHVAPPPPPARPPVRPPVRREPAPVADQPAPPSRGGVLADGTTISAVALDSVHSRYTQVGDVVRVRVDQDVMQGNRVVIPAGAVVTMSVTDLAGAGSRGEKGTLSMTAQDVQIDGRSYPISARATDYQYEMKARGIGAGDVAKTGVGAAIGAILGHVIGGKTGTIVGAVGGGAAGAAIAAKSADRDIIVHSGATVTLQLTGEFAKR